MILPIHFKESTIFLAVLSLILFVVGGGAFVGIATIFHDDLVVGGFGAIVILEICHFLPLAFRIKMGSRPHLIYTIAICGEVLIVLELGLVL